MTVFHFGSLIFVLSALVTSLSPIDPIFTLTNVTDFDYSPTGDAIVTTNTNEQLSLWDIQTQYLIWTVDTGGGSIGPLWSPDGSMIATTFAQGVYLWDAITGARLRSLSEHPTELVDEMFAENAMGVSSKVFSPDGTILATANTYDKLVMLWDTETGEILHVLGGHEDGVRNLTFNSQGTILATGSMFSGKVKLWNPLTGEAIREIAANGEAMAISPDNTMLASTAGRLIGYVFIHDIETGQLLHSYEALLMSWQVQWTADGNNLMGLFNDGILVSDGFDYSGSAVRVWDVTSGEERQVFDASSPQTLAYEPDTGEILLGIGSGGSEGYILIWNQETDDVYNTPLVSGESHIFDVATTEITHFALSPDETRLAAGTEDGQVIIWDFATGEQLLTLESPNPLGWQDSIVHNLQWSADGETLAALFGDHTLAFWDVAAY